MVVGIVGLGLIGGSLAKAYKRSEGIEVWAYDADTSVTEFAMLAGAVDNELTDDCIGKCDLLLIAIDPEAAVNYMKRVAHHIRCNTLVIDCCGTKRRVCEVGFELASKWGFTYAGGHPMAGTHLSGFKASRADMFDNACMVIVPPRFDDIVLLDRIKLMLEPAGFGRISVTTAERHDELIAFTSQMAHVVSNGYIKSPTAREHSGFSAGSYKDLTRVAWLNPDMWTILFMENRDNLIKELGFFIDRMIEYREALSSENYGKLRQLLDDGRRIKQEVDG